MYSCFVELILPPELIMTGGLSFYRVE